MKTEIHHSNVVDGRAVPCPCGVTHMRAVELTLGPQETMRATSDGNFFFVTHGEGGETVRPAAWEHVFELNVYDAEEERLMELEEYEEE